MARPLIERRLSEIGERLRRLRADVAVTEEQLAHLSGEADDARVRATVAEAVGRGASTRDAATEAARLLGVSRRRAYRLALEA